MGEISFQQKQPQNLRPSSEKFKGYGFVPTNYLEWQQYTGPKARVILISIYLAIPSFILLYTLISYIAPNIEYVEKADRYWVIDPFYLHIGYAWDNNITSAMKEYYGDLLPFLIVSLIFVAIFIVLLILSIKKLPKQVPYPEPINEIADYVQKAYSSRVYSFFLKDGKMGLLNSKTLSVQLNPVYDKLKWKENQRFIEAEMDGVSFVIDVNGNILK